MQAPVALFDLDGTLVDTMPDLLATLDVVLSEAGLESLPKDQAYATVGHGSKVMIERALRCQGIEPTAERVQPMHLRFLDHYEAHIAVGSRPFPGATAALDRLSAAGARLAVCTNKFEALSVRLLGELGLLDRFDAIVGPDTLGVRKPDPGHILGAIEKAGGDPARAIMVGDSRTDIDAAKAAKVPVIAVDFGYTDTPVRELAPDYVISHYDALWDVAAPLLRLRTD